MQQLQYQVQSNILQNRFIYRHIEGVFIAPKSIQNLARKIVARPKAHRIDVIDKSEEQIIKQPLSSYLVSDTFRKSEVPELSKHQTLAEITRENRIPVYQYSKLTRTPPLGGTARYRSLIKDGILLSVALAASSVNMLGVYLKNITESVMNRTAEYTGKLSRPYSPIAYTAHNGSMPHWKQRIKSLLPAFMLAAAALFSVSMFSFEMNNPSRTPQTLGVTSTTEDEENTSSDDARPDDGTADPDNPENGSDPAVLPGASSTQGSGEEAIPMNQPSSSAGAPARTSTPIGGSGGGDEPTASQPLPVAPTPSPTPTQPAPSTDPILQTPLPETTITVPEQNVDLFGTSVIQTGETSITID